MALKRFTALRQTFREITSAKATFWRRLQMFFRFARLCLSSSPTIGELMHVPPKVREAWNKMQNGHAQDWDKEFDEMARPVKNPVVEFHDALMNGGMFRGRPVAIDEAFVFEGHFDERGKLLRDPKALEAVNKGWPRASRTVHVQGTEAYKAYMMWSQKVHEAQPARSKMSREARAFRYAIAKKIVKEGFGGDGFLTTTGFGPNTNYDPNQYTEFAPTYGGPFFKQLYLYDYLKQHAYAFEAWNHNPLAKRIIELLTQYTLGRRLTLRIKDEKKEKIWDAANEKNKIIQKLSRFWCNEASIYGELMINTETWNAEDPSTIWDIITDPDNIDDVYYYYQSYPTAFQMFTGYRVPGEPGSEKAEPQKYITRQIPAFKILHLKLHCVSNEKRGRSVLFPILGWLKRVKDLYNAQVIRQWLLSCFVWDVTVKGDQGDVDAYAGAWQKLPDPGGMHIHNESVERKPMAAVEQGAGGGGGAGEISDNLLAFIATAVGIPKEFFNIIAKGGGSRAASLTSAEPFTKVIEDLQASLEEFTKEIFKRVMEQAGVEYKVGDVEVLFPSVTKDTTSETVKNLQIGAQEGWISHEDAATMFAKELNITEYDYMDTQKRIKKLSDMGIAQAGNPPAPAGRFGATPDEPNPSPIHGQGKVDLKDQLNTL